MQKLSLTDFVDIVSKSGTPKATKVNSVIKRPKYTPATDFYRPLRDGIIDTHRSDLPKGNLNKLLVSLSDQKKASNYPEAIKGYTTWWGNKKMQWFEPAYATFERHGVAVSVNPELGLVINGIPHLIKLYFKAEPLTKNRIDIATHLMVECLRQQCDDVTVMAILDVRNGKLFSANAPIPNLTAMLSAELAYISALLSD
ncbi:hypothetical protein [Geomonas subterranea]|uniref:hypothetical protein n=1 Tax=Geomonas subterranea TaxID=2847989 RepID=UPI001CD58BEC|nr:hypothetical protein [Geomonas fuzhouensis]